MAANRAHADIYQLAISLHFLLRELDAENAYSGLWVGTVEDATSQLAALVARWPDEGREVVEFIENSKSGPHYADVTCVMRSMLARAKGNELLAEMGG